MARTALVIGASRGIGREFVRQFIADGWKVFATARDETSLAMLTSRVRMQSRSTSRSPNR